MLMNVCRQLQGPTQEAHPTSKDQANQRDMNRTVLKFFCFILVERDVLYKIQNRSQNKMLRREYSVLYEFVYAKNSKKGLKPSHLPRGKKPIPGGRITECCLHPRN